MKKIIGLVALTFLWAGAAFGQTATPTLTNTPVPTATRTPTVSSLNIPGFADLGAFNAGTVAVDPASIATVSRGTTVVALAGIQPGDLLILYPPTGLNDDLLYVGHRIVSNNTISIDLYNPTAGAINDTSKNWTYLWWNRTNP